ncbi:SIP domain-containing protein [Actinosynnema sp. CA-248983]
MPARRAPRHPGARGRAGAAIRAATLSTVDFAWARGESAPATGVRRHLVKERGLDRRSVMFSGYWKVGQARM